MAVRGSAFFCPAAKDRPDGFDANQTPLDGRLSPLRPMLRRQYSEQCQRHGLWNIPQGSARHDPGRYRRALSLLRAARGKAISNAHHRRGTLAWSGVAKVIRHGQIAVMDANARDQAAHSSVVQTMSARARKIQWVRAPCIERGLNKTGVTASTVRNQSEYIGLAISSGCIRMTNEDVIDHYTESQDTANAGMRASTWAVDASHWTVVRV